MIGYCSREAWWSHPSDRALNPIELVMVGAGNRGYHAYGGYARAHPGEVRVVAVAEPTTTAGNGLLRATGYRSTSSSGRGTSWC